MVDINKEDFKSEPEPLFKPNAVENFAVDFAKSEAKLADDQYTKGQQIPSQQRADVARLSVRSGLPQQLVNDNLDELKTLDKDKKITGNFWKSSPLTAQYIRDSSPFYVGSDEEILALGNLETLLGKNPRLWRKPQKRIETEADTLARRELGRMKGFINAAGEFDPSIGARLDAPLGIELDEQQTEELFNTLLQKNREALEFEENFIASDSPVGGIEQITRMFKENESFMLPFIGAVRDAQSMIGLYNAAIAVDKGEANEDQIDLLVRYSRMAEASERRGQDITGLTAEIGTQLVPFAVELGFTGGVYNSAKFGTIKLTRKGLQTLLRGSMEKVLKRKLPLAGRVDNFVSRNTSRVVGTLTQSLAAGPGRIAAATAESMTPIGYTYYGQDGSVGFKVVPDSGKEFWVSLKDSVHLEFNAVFSEKTGGIAGKAFGRTPIGQSLLKRYAPAGGSVAKLNTALKKGGIHGIFAEMGEEEVNKVMDDIGGFGSYKLPTGKELGAQALAFGGPTTIRLAATVREQKRLRAIEESRRAEDQEAAEAVEEESEQVEEQLRQEVETDSEVYLKNIGDLVEQNQTIIQNDPIRFKKIIHEKVKGTDQETVKMPVAQFNQMFEGKVNAEGQIIKPEDVIEEVMGDKAAYNEAVETGGDIEIPMEEYVVTLNQGEFSEEMRKITRFSPEDLTSAETLELLDQLEQSVAIDEGEFQDQEKRAIAAISAKSVADDIRSQFDETSSKFNAVTADHYAKLYERVFRTFGLISGEDPLALYERFKVSITERKAAEQRQAKKEEVEKTIGELDQAIEENLEARQNASEIIKKEVADLEAGIQTDPVASAQIVAEAEAEMRRADKALKADQKRLAELQAEEEVGDATFFQTQDLPETLEIDGVERHTRNSEGNQIAKDEEGIRNFWAWFGDSKVVDEQGRPLVQHHSGSFTKDDGAFIESEHGIHFGTKQAAEDRSIIKPSDELKDNVKVTQENGRWFWESETELDQMETDNEEGFDSERAAFADAFEAIEAHHQSVIDALAEDTIDLEETTAAYLKIENPVRHKDQGVIWAGVIETAKESGHDGIVYKNEVEDIGADSYLVYTSDQIKSTENVGAFSPETRNIFNQSIPEQFQGPNIVLGNMQIHESGEGISKDQTVGNIKWTMDKNAIGGTPAHEEINNHGILVHMDPQDFLDLNPPFEQSDETAPFLENAVEDGKEIAPPFLLFDPEEGRITGHEGRHRALTSQKMNPNEKMPVVFIIRYEPGKQRNLKPALLDQINNGLTADSSAADPDLRIGGIFDGAEISFTEVPNSFENTPIGEAVVEARSRNTFNQSIPEQSDRTLGFFSGLKTAVEGLKQEKGTASQFLAQIKKLPGVKQEELEVTGLPEFLKGSASLDPNRKITKAEILEYLGANGVQIEEVTLDSNEESDVPTFDDIEYSGEERARLSEDDPIAFSEEVEFEIQRITEEAEDSPEDYEFAYDEEGNLDEDAIREAAHEQALYSEEEFGDFKETITVHGTDTELELRWNDDAGTYSVTDENGDVVGSGDGTGNGDLGPAAREAAISHLLDSGIVRTEDEGEGQTKFSQWKMPGGENYREIKLTIPVNRLSPDSEFFNKAHFEEGNIIVFIRVTDRVDAEGNRVLFIEEIQSDWHQAGRKRGYRVVDAVKEEEADIRLNELIPEAEKIINENWQWQFDDATEVLFQIRSKDNWVEFLRLEELPKEKLETLKEYRQAAKDLKKFATGVPDAPFKGNAWAELAIKRIITMAAEGGYDKVAWTTGAQQIDRFEDSLRQNVDEIEYAPVGEGLFRVTAFKGDNEVFNQSGLSEQDIQDLLGKDIAKKIVNNEGERRGGFKGEPRDGLVSTFDESADGWMITLNGEVIGFNIDLDVAQSQAKQKTDVTQEELDIADDFDEPGRSAGFVLKGDGLSIGGEGMKSFYDRTVPNLFKKVVKKLDKGAKVGREKIATEREDLFGEGDVGFLGKGDFEFETVHSLDITPKLSETVQERGLPLFQKQPEGEIIRGQFSMGTGSSVDIVLMEDADFTTFLHESGHFFLELMRDLATAPNANPQLVADFQIVKEWFKETEYTDAIKEMEKTLKGLKRKAKTNPELENEVKNLEEAISIAKKGGQKFQTELIDTFGANVDQRLWGAFMTPYHEKWARGFEMYLADPNNSPVKELNGLFHQFRAWIVKVYNDLTNLNVELTNDVKDVMGRMLATQEEIQEAQAQQGMVPLFPDPAAVGMTEETAAKYQEDISEALKKAEEELSAKIMEVETRKKTAAWRDRKKVIEPEVEAEANEMKVYKALANMQLGKNPDGTPLDSGVSPIKLNKKDLLEAIGPERFAELRRPPIYAAKGGVQLNVAAAMFGYESEAEMMFEIELSEKKADFVKNETERRLHEEFGDPMSPDIMPEEVNKAIHNTQRSKLLNLEIRHLASDEFRTNAELTKRIAKPIPTIKEVRTRAQQIINNKDVNKISPITYKRGEAKASRTAIEAYLRGDIEAAFDAKQLELLNHELFRAATAAKEQIKKDLKFTKNYKQPDKKLKDKRDMGLVSVGRAILADYEIGNFKEKFDDKGLQYLKTYGGGNDNPDAFDVLTGMRNKVSTNAAPYEEVSYGNFQSMMEAVRAFWLLSRAAKTVEKDGKRVDSDIVAKEFAEVLGTFDTFAEGSDKRIPFREMTWGELKQGVSGSVQWLTRMEHWVNKMDDGNPNGIFHTFIWNPVMDASTEMRLESKKLKDEYIELLKLVSDSLNTGNIEANELADDFFFADKAELLGALMHVGNESNKSKLIRGRKWGEFDEDGQLKTERWDKFIDRMISEGILTKNDFDFVQGVWDLYESTKPKAQTSHYKLYGHHFNEVTANGFTNEFGTYRGGYAPAVIDYDEYERAAKDEDIALTKDDLEATAYSDMFPTTPKGNFLDRNEAFAAPLELSLELAPHHIDKVLRFAYLEVPVRDIYNLINHDLIGGNKNKKMEGALNAIHPDLIENLIMPWLNRVARQQITKPVHGKTSKRFDSMFRWLRKKTIQSQMFLNIKNAAEQPTGLAVAASEVHPKYLSRALKEFVKNPKAFDKFIRSQSKFMETRNTKSVIEQGSEIEKLVISPTKFQQMNEFIDQNALIAQMITQNAVDNVTWYAASIQATESKEDWSDKDIERIADGIVRRTQGDFNPESVSAIEGKSAFVRWFITYFGYFNMLFNQLNSRSSIISRSANSKGAKAAKMFYLYFTVLSVPAILSESIDRIAREGFDSDDDDEYLDDYLDILVGSQVRTLTAMVPDAGIMDAMINQFDDKWWNDDLGDTPVFGHLTNAVGALKLPFQAVAPDTFGEVNARKAIRSVAAATNLATGLPTGQVGKTAGFLNDLGSGEQDADDFMELMRGIIGGRSGNQ